MKLTSPLVFFDLETTGTQPNADRIVQFACVKRYPDGKEVEWETLVNPGCPIPPEASSIHGITNEQVADAPTFAALAPKLVRALDGCDLGGFNVRRFDIPMLLAEFARAGQSFSIDSRAIIDAMSIFYLQEPRDLSAAVKFYLLQEMTGAHNALNDVRATLRVFDAQTKRYKLPDTASGVSELCAGDSVDLAGKLVWKEGEVTVAFGKQKGKALRWLAKNDRGFLDWMLRGEFDADTKAIVSQALQGNHLTKEKA